MKTMFPGALGLGLAVLLSAAAPASADPVTLINPAADASESGFGGFNAIDGVLSGTSGWSGPNDNRNQVTFAAATQTDVTASALRFQLHQLFEQPDQHLIREFRLSYTTDARSVFQGSPHNGSWTNFTNAHISPLAGVSFSEQVDGRIVTSPNATIPATGVYDLTYSGAFNDVTGVRVEVFYDNGATYGGWSTAGADFVLTELQLDTVANPVPEPSTWLLALCSGLAVFFVRRR